MSALILVLPVILPIAGGALILWLPFRSDRARNLYAEILVCATSAAAFYAMLACPGKTATLYTLSQGFSLASARTARHRCLPEWSLSCGRW